MHFVCNRYLDLEPFEPFETLESAEVVSAWRNLTDTMKVSFARNVNMRDVLKVGHTARLRLGYDGEVRNVFEGYVTKRRPNIPLEIEAEDEMWQLKRYKVSAAWRNASLRDVLTTILKGRPFTCPDIQLGRFTINDMTPALLLNELKEKQGLYTYFRDGQFHSGLPYTDSFMSRTSADPIVFDTRSDNVADASGLEYTSEDDRKVRVKAVSLLDNNTEISIDPVGDADGDETTLHAYGITNKADLKRFAEQELAKMKRGGYGGSFVAHGLPAVRFGDAIYLRDPDYPERNGYYRVDQVTSSFSRNRGIKQQIYPGKQLAL